MTLLYDLVADRGETTNRADSSPDLVARLSAKHAAWVAALPAASPVLPPVRPTVTEMHGELVELLF